MVQRAPGWVAIPASGATNLCNGIYRFVYAQTRSWMLVARHDVGVAKGI